MAQALTSYEQKSPVLDIQSVLSEYFLDIASFWDRNTDNLLGASNDLEAVQMWLRAKAGRSSHTLDAYLKESRRFLVWLYEHNLTLSSVRVDDVHRYFALLRSPPEHWLRPRKLHKDEALQMTQLLINGLSDKSLQYTQTVLGQLFSYLQHAQYVQGNPFKLSTRFSIMDHQVTEKSLDVKTWRYLWQWVCQRQCEQPSNLISVRSRWLLALLYHTGLRREEVAKAKMLDCILGDYGWELKVLGKGRKLRRITLNRHVIEELKLYRQSMGLLPEPHGQENIPLVMSIYKNRLAQHMTPRSIGLLIHQLMQQASMSCQDFLIAQTLTDVSTHWLRHTHATHRLAAGASLETTQDELGHSDPKTTRIYAKVLDDQRRRDAEKLAQWNKN